jgi:hypothetical protein
MHGWIFIVSADVMSIIFIINLKLENSKKNYFFYCEIYKKKTLKFFYASPHNIKTIINLPYLFTLFIEGFHHKADPRRIL